MLEQVERQRSLAHGGGSSTINKTERRTLLYIIQALALAAYERDLQRPYAIAGTVCPTADLLGINPRQETVAQKLKDAAALAVAQIEVAA